ncbi:sulfatase [Rhodopirellula sp. SWK7]|uniref:sulfatase n=1 Tax=Rhodopirellula sp. SWK7 TaxID=595460 RepID=UPI0002BE20C8|nr:sulfatase [Rhodopirellula sp. SWK7]EMI40671.1 sulfatase family protein [Rhodopirellula sp. SWK7]
MNAIGNWIFLFVWLPLLLQIPVAESQAADFAVAESPDRESGDSAMPNIIYINADDLGVMDVGFNSDRYHTPNIDRLRAEGMLFTNAYAPAANCAPSRACVMSGQYGPRHGVYTVGSSERGKSHDRKLIPTQNTNHLSNDDVTLPAVLQDAGYQTIHLGKWHLGPDPTQQGFHVNIGGDTSGSPSGGGYFSPYKSGPMKRFSDQYPAKTHRVDIFADQAIRFMRANQTKPFFMHMAYYSVHTGIEPVPGLVEKYQDKENVHAAYASMVEKMDQGIGKILDELDSLSLTDKTFVLFCSDNGGVRALSDQMPYRSGKGSYFEGGIREPLVVRWPGKITPGSTSDVPVIGVDFFPTFLDVAGVKSPSGQQLDGVSLMPLLTQTGDLEERALYWHFPVYLQSYARERDDSHDPLFRTRPGSAMRLGKWKLHEYFEDGRLELYDLEADIGERRNLADRYPEKTTQLHAMMKRWREETGAPVPTQLNPNYMAADTGGKQKTKNRKTEKASR